MNILELGSSPGGWSQVICELNKRSKIDAFDLLAMKFKHENIYFFRQDFFKFDFKSFNKKYDLILSDMAPNTTGNKNLDSLATGELCLEAMNFSKNIIKKNGFFVSKIFMGSNFNEILNIAKGLFKNVSIFKPKSSRKESKENYIICKNIK